MEDFGIFYGHLAYIFYFMAIWHIFPRFGTFLSVLECSTKKNLATLDVVSG
jgi:hypothetical protein